MSQVMLTKIALTQELRKELKATEEGEVLVLGELGSHPDDSIYVGGNLGVNIHEGGAGAIDLNIYVSIIDGVSGSSLTNSLCAMRVTDEDIIIEDWDVTKSYSSGEYVNHLGRLYKYTGSNTGTAPATSGVCTDLGPAVLYPLGFYNNTYIDVAPSVKNDVFFMYASQ